MKKTLRTVVATLLILVMLFSVSVTTIFAADSNTAGGTGSVAPIPPSSDTGSGDSINLGNWIKIGYDDDSIDIVWYHMIGAMLETISKNPEQLEQLSEMLTEAIEHLVIDPLEEGMIGGGNSGDVVLDDVTDIDALWDAALTTYLSKHSAEYGSDKTEATVAFFKKVMNEDINSANSAAKDFTEYVCGLISVGVRASNDPDAMLAELKEKIKIVVGGVTLEGGAALKARLDEKIYKTIEDYAKDTIKKEVVIYINALKNLQDGETLVLTDVQKIIEAEAVKYARNEVLAYLGGETTDFDVQIKNFIDSEATTEAKSVITEVLGDYAAIKKESKASYASGTPEAYAYAEIDAYVKLAVENYFKALCGVAITEATLLDNNATLKTKLDAVLLNTLKNEFKAIVTYLEGGMTGNAPATFPIFEAKIQAEFPGVSMELIPTDELADLEDELVAEVLANLDATSYANISTALGDTDSIIAKVSEAELNSAIASVSSEDLDDILEIVTDKIDNATLISIVNTVSDAEIVSLLTKVVKTDGFDVNTVVLAVEEKIDKITITDEQYDVAYQQLFNNTEISKAKVEAKIESLENLLADEYDETVTELENDPELEIADLLTYLQAMTVTFKSGDTVGSPKDIYVFEDGKTTLKSAAVKELLKELPTPDEIANMNPADMKFTFTVEIVTDFSDVKFDINISVGNNGHLVQAFAKAITELVTVNRDSGKISLNLDLFENTGDVLSAFIESANISPELRSELFGLLGLSVEELYNYVSDRNRFTFAKYKSIISAIDFESIFKNFGIENEPGGYYVDYNKLMLEILCKDEEKFEDVRTKLLDTLDSVPESIKEKTVFDLYEGNGIFVYQTHVKLPVSALINKIGASLPAFSTFMPLLSSFAGNRVIDSDVEITVNGPELYKVTYVVTDPATGVDVTKTGLLPEGVSVHGLFSPIERYSGLDIERYDGYRIEKWSLTPGGEAVETVPANDVTLYATLESIKTAITVYDFRGIEVDGDKLKEGVVYVQDRAYTLFVDVIYTSNTHEREIKYQWYKGSTLLVGKTDSFLEIYATVANSGDYWCKVTIESDGDMSGVTVDSVKQTVTINPRPIDINMYWLEWNYNPQTPFVYSEGKFYSVTLTKASLDEASLITYPSIITTPVYTDVYMTNAGVYTARAYFDFEDEEIAANCVFLNSDGTVSDLGESGYVECEWQILPQQISSADGFEWSIDEGESFVYEYGVTHSVSLTVPENLVVVGYESEVATNAGSYTTVADVESSNPNYVWIGDDPSLNWTVEKQRFDLANVAWDYDVANPFVFTGSEQGISVVDVPADIVWTYGGNVATNAGNYTAIAEPDPNNALNNQNYVFMGEVPACAWTIAKQTIESLLELGWNYSDAFTYNGDGFTVELDLPEGFDNRIVVVYTSNTASDAGVYTAKAELVALDSANFEVVGEKISFECEWTINKAVIDMSGVSFKDKYAVKTGEPIGIEIEGKLPAGVSVKYSEPAREVGEYEMTATFIYDEKNFEPIAPMTAKLTIKPYYPDVKEFSSTDSSGNTIVDIKAAQKGVPSNYKLNVNDLTAQYNAYDFGNFFGYGTNGKVLAVYDIHFAENGTETPVYDVFTVKIRIPETFSGNINNVRVVYISDNGELEDMEAMIDGDCVAYETIHFSVYALVEVVERVEEAKTIDFLSILPYAIAALVLILLLIIIIVVIKKKRKKNKPEEPKANDEPTPTEPVPEVAAEAEPEAPTEEIAAEAEETVEEEKPTIVIHDSIEDIITEETTQEEGAEPAAVPEIVHVRCRSSFTSRLIQSEEPIQDYYTILKNALLSYKGVKARMSFNFESFNSGRVQCAKLNVKGKSFLVYLGLDLSEYNVNKYHFSDASDKPKFEKVPMMLKVKSERSLKYALELIEEVMKKNGFEKDPKFVEQDYHMPYETTAALAEKELVKLILPQGVSLEDGIKLVKADVGALLDEAKSGDEDDED